MSGIRTGTVLAVFLGGLLAGPAMVAGHGGATGIVKERMDFMKGLGDAVKALSAMFKGEIAYDPDVALTHARVIQEHAPELPALFPAGSNADPSEALDVIWVDWPAFEKIAGDLETESAAFAAVMASRADQQSALPAFARLGKTCGACHERFRVKKDH